MMKRMLSMLLAVLMCLSLVACGQQETTDNGSSSDATQQGGTAWPEHAIEMVIPYSAGGDTDTWGRTFVQHISEYLGVPVTVTNMPGSSGSVGADYVRTAANDGYTVLFAHSALLVSKIFGQVDFTYTDFANANVLVDDDSYYLNGNPNKWPGGWEEVSAYAKEHPGEVVLGYAPGSQAHLFALMLMGATGLDFKLVDIGDQSSALVELLAGRIDILPGSIASLREYKETGELVPFVSYKAERDTNVAPDVPTWSELGYDLWGGYLYGTHFPTGTDQAIIDKWNAACAYAQEQDDVKAVYEKYAANPVMWSGADATKAWDDLWDTFMKYEEYFTW